MADQDWFDLFKARLKQATTAEGEQRQRELDDLAFEAGDHWDPAVKASRDKEGRPSLTIDLLSGPVKQITNQLRTARPGIRIDPVGGGADVDHAERWQGLIRRVERLSQSGRVYSWAGQHQVKMGRGFWVVRNIEVGEDGEQDIRLEEVDNQHTILVDPNTKKLDGSDKRWAIRFEDLPIDEYRDRNDSGRLASAIADGQLRSVLGASPPEWLSESKCRIAEYYWIEEQTRWRLILENGDRVWEDELATEGRKKKPVLPEGAVVRRRVRRVTKTVKRAMVNGVGDKWDEVVIPGEFIPIVMVFGERRNIDGKIDYRGVVRMAKDPSRMEDFLESSLMEAVSDAKTAPWIAEFDQISEFLSQWQSARPPKVLTYKRVTDGGTLVPPPARVSSGVDVSALTMAAQRMQNHVMKAAGQAEMLQEETTSLQSQMSGRAILARRQGQELGTSDYLENLGDGIVLTAKIIMSMARAGVYDTPRLLRIIGADEQPQAIVTYMGDAQRAYAEQLQQTHQVQEMFDLSVGDFDITISPGKNYLSARQEGFEMMTSALSAVPQAAPMILPTLFKFADFPGAQEIAAKLEPKQDDIPPQVAQRLQQLEQQLKQAAEIITTDAAKQQAQVEIAQQKATLELDLQRLKDMTTLELARIKDETERFKIDRQAAWALAQQDDAQAHEVGLSAAQTEAAAVAQAHAQAAASFDTKEAVDE